jgi:hypothetical protein
MSRLSIKPILTLLLTAACLAAPQAVPAQDARGPEASFGDLKKKWDPINNLIQEFSRGDKQPSERDADKIKAAAEWHVYRLRVSTIQGTPNKLYNDVVKDFLSLQGRMQTKEYKEKNQAFQQRLNRELLTCFRDVLDKNGEAQVVVNAALMFPSWASNGSEEVADYLAELVRDPKRHDAVKLYALRGLGEYFKNRAFSDLNKPRAGVLAPPDQVENDAKRVQAVIDFVKRKSPITDDMTSEQAEAVRYVRREAIRALAKVQVPALFVDPKANKVKAPVAVALLGLLAGKSAGVDPPLSLLEQCDASLALCNMKWAGIIPEYDPKLAAPFVARTLAEFAKEYNDDFNNVIFNQKQQGQKPGALYPWLSQTERFRGGLKELVKNSNDPAAAKLALDLDAKTNLLLKNTGERKLAVDGQVINNLLTFAQGATPKMKSFPVFRGIKDKALEVPLE